MWPELNVRMPKATHYYSHERSDLLEWVGGDFARVLDVGCGAGSNAPWYRRHGAREIVGVEVDAPSAAHAAAVFDRVINEPVETAIGQIEGPFDLIVCADILEHLVDPLSVVKQLRALSSDATVLAVSIPNIRFAPAMWRIAFGRGFQYEDQGIFDATHLRFFTKPDAYRLLREGGWIVDRWGARAFGRFLPMRNLAKRVTRGWSDQWLAEQLFAVARRLPSAEGQ